MEMDALKKYRRFSVRWLATFVLLLVLITIASRGLSDATAVRYLSLFVVAYAFGQIFLMFETLWEAKQTTAIVGEMREILLRSKKT